MRFSYIHEGKVYTVVTLKDGSVLEIRRGNRTFPEYDREDQQTWPSLDAWEATWPKDATTTVSSYFICRSGPPVTLASTIINRFLKGRHTNLDFPSPHNITEFSRKLALFEEYEKSGDTPCLVEKAKYEIQYYKTQLDNYAKFLRREYRYPPAFIGHSYVYVSHDGGLHPIYHNRYEDVVLIRVHGKGNCTPEELGITVDSKFYARDAYDDMFVPL